MLKGLKVAFGRGYKKVELSYDSKRITEIMNNRKARISAGQSLM